VVSVLTLPLVATAASARPKILYSSEEFELQARLLPHTLVLAHSNLVDLPVRFRCRTEVDEEVYRTHGLVDGLLYPHTVSRWRFPTDASHLGQATAICAVEVDEAFTVFFRGELLEVLGSGGVTEEGTPWAALDFINISPTERLHYGCTWQWGDPPWDSSSYATHLPPGSMNSTSTSVELSTISDMACTESVYDPPS
jgi:hypothetical protein